MSKIGKDAGRPASQKKRMGRAANLEQVDRELATAAEAARAIDFIETHLFEPLTVETIARHCNTSVFHFSRRFAGLQGEGVMAYVRGRRLDVAARRLTADPHLSLSSLALDCGFETQAAFTRAFTRAFGAAPGAFRRAETATIRKRRLKMPEPIELHETQANEGPIRLAGLAGRFDPSSYVRIAELWKTFSGMMVDWRDRPTGTETVGGFRDRNLTARSFEHLAAVRVAPDAKLPPGFVVWDLPAQTWMKYRQPMTGAELHLQLGAAETEIRGERLPKSGRKLDTGPDLQIYAADFSNAPGWWIEHWLPVEG